MSKNFQLDISGFRTIQERLIKASREMQSEVNEELKSGAREIVRNAKDDVRKNSFNTGRLAGAISFSGSKMDYDVVSPISYSPYIEWGTKRRTKVPAKYAAYAAQFKGLKTGSAEEALFAIKEWVRRKKVRIDSAATYKSGKRKGQNKKLTLEETAYIIFHFIMINGIKPRPFFFKNLDKQEPIIIKNVQTVLNNI